MSTAFIKWDYFFICFYQTDEFVQILIFVMAFFFLIGFGFDNKKRGAEKLPTQLSKMAKKHMKTEKSLTEEQKQLLKTINEKQSVMKKGRLGAKKALIDAV